MITRDNIREVLNLIDKDQLEQFYMDKTTDHYLLSLHVFNAMSCATLEPFYYGIDNEYVQDDATSDGSIILDFDSLSQLYSEQGLDIFEFID